MGQARGRAQGTKAKNATSCGNVFVTNIVLASCPQESVRRNGEQRLRSRHNNKAVQILLIVKFERRLIFRQVLSQPHIFLSVVFLLH